MDVRKNGKPSQVLDDQVAGRIDVIMQARVALGVQGKCEAGAAIKNDVVGSLPSRMNVHDDNPFIATLCQQRTAFRRLLQHNASDGND